MDFTELKAIGSINVERLLSLWDVEYKFITDVEIDILNKARGDRHFGSCRYNMEKDIGSDFAMAPLDDSVFKSLGESFDASDFASNTHTGFDIIGLAKMLFGYRSNKDAADRLARDLQHLDGIAPIARVSAEEVATRKALGQQAKDRKVDYARVLLERCSSYRNTLGETYLTARGLRLTGLDDTIRFHGAMQHVDNYIKALYPALIFPIQAKPGGVVEGIHRIFLSHEGTSKAKVTNPKMALGTIKGNAIWFGVPDETLYIAEGPENALTIFHSGARFVACSINAGNLPFVHIPDGVQTVVVCADRDKVGLDVAHRTVALRRLDGINMEVLLPEERKLLNGKWADFNDILRGTR